DSLLHDEPIDLAGWQPQNFDPAFAGPVRADDALRRSLNIPAIRVAQRAGLPRCATILRQLGLPLSAQTEARAGLGLAVGTVEVSLLDLTNAYAALGRAGRFQIARLFPDEPTETRPALSPRACDMVNHILSNESRRAAS